MQKKDLKKGVVYKYKGTSPDGANILFKVKKDGSYYYDGFIVLHWSGNRVSIPAKGYCINEHHLPSVTIANKKTTQYYSACEKHGKDVGGFDWHDSNKD